MSLAVSTPCTPGSARAAETSIERMRPWATELRRNAACNMSLRARSSTYCPRPRRKRRSSRRSIALPMSELTVLICALAHDLQRRPYGHRPSARRARPRRWKCSRCSGRDCPKHLAHARGVAIRLLAQQHVRRRDHARRTEAALQRVMLAKRLLQRRQVVVVGQPFDRHDLGCPRPARRASGTSAPPRRRRSRCRRRTRRARSRHGFRSAADGDAGSPPASAAARPRPDLLAVDLELH